MKGVIWILTDNSYSSSRPTGRCDSCCRIPKARCSMACRSRPTKCHHSCPILSCPLRNRSRTSTSMRYGSRGACSGKTNPGGETSGCSIYSWSITNYACGYQGNKTCPPSWAYSCPPCRGANNSATCPTTPSSYFHHFPSSLRSILLDCITSPSRPTSPQSPS